MRLTRLVIAATLLVAASSMPRAQTVTKAEVQKASVTITAIDTLSRTITVKGDDGKEDTIWAPPEMARFNELKVGDRVNLTYAESLVFQLRKPGAASQKPSETAAVAATGTALPGAKAARQVTTTVTVKSVDPAVPSITVTTADGRTVTRKIADKANLQGVAPGDRIDITYTEAILANVERAK
jgi:Cu/Ag efflux protein CusF